MSNAPPRRGNPNIRTLGEGGDRLSHKTGFECPVCGKGYVRDAALLEHIGKSHGGRFS